MAVSDRGVLLSWIERVGTTTSLKFAEQTASGWTAPMTAASGPDWFLSYADVPSVMRMTDGTLVAQWLEATDAFIDAYNLQLSYSKDDGETWAPPFMPHDDGTTTQHRFASLVEMAAGIWGHLARWTQQRIRLRRSGDRDDDAAVCLVRRGLAADCGYRDRPPGVRVLFHDGVMTSDGVVAAFRDLQPMDDHDIRDIGVSRLGGGAWTPTAIVSPDHWMRNLCPVNGPMLSARGRDVAAAWFTVKDNQGQAYAAFSNDAGRTWGTPIRLDDGGSLGRVDVEMLEDGSAVATWVEYAEGLSDFRLRLVDPSGERSEAFTVTGVSAGRASGFPRVALSGDELVFAWSESASVGSEDTGALTVQTAVASLP